MYLQFTKCNIKYYNYDNIIIIWIQHVIADLNLQKLNFSRNNLYRTYK